MAVPASLLAAATVAIDPDALRCTVRAGRVEIVLPRDMDRRISSLAVVRRGTWTFVVDDGNRFAPFRPGVRRLTLRTATQLGSVDGRTVRAFPRAGTYRIVFADNLETEPAAMIARDCVVRIR